MLLTREDKSRKQFFLYNIFTEGFEKRINKLDLPKDGMEDSDAFDVDPDCRILIYSSGSNFYFLNLKLSENL